MKSSQYLCSKIILPPPPLFTPGESLACCFFSVSKDKQVKKKLKGEKRIMITTKGESPIERVQFSVRKGASAAVARGGEREENMVCDTRCRWRGSVTASQQSRPRSVATVILVVVTKLLLPIQNTALKLNFKCYPPLPYRLGIVLRTQWPANCGGIPSIRSVSKLESPDASGFSNCFSCIDRSVSLILTS